MSALGCVASSLAESESFPGTPLAIRPVLNSATLALKRFPLASSCQEMALERKFDSRDVQTHRAALRRLLGPGRRTPGRSRQILEIGLSAFALHQVERESRERHAIDHHLPREQRQERQRYFRLFDAGKDPAAVRLGQGRLADGDADARKETEA